MDVHIPAGKAVSTLEVPLIDDVIVEGNEHFSVHLSTADSGLAISTSAANVTIREDDSKRTTSIHTLTHLIAICCYLNMDKLLDSIHTLFVRSYSDI